MDPWPGSIQQPSSLHKYLYVSANPVNSVDPSGLISEREAERARRDIKFLQAYSVIINEDFGWETVPGTASALPGTNACRKWVDGNWKSADEIRYVRVGVEQMGKAMGGADQFARKVGRTVVKRGGPLPGYLALTGWNITFYERTFWHPSGRMEDPQLILNTVVHEFAHAWDTHQLFRYSTLLMVVTKSKWTPGGGYQPVGTPAHRPGYGLPSNQREDWADAVGDYLFYRPGYAIMDSTRKTFVYHALATKNVAQFYVTIMLQLGITTPIQ
jgi:hypothetical protein